jgi:hypothetical protein
LTIEAHRFLSFDLPVFALLPNRRAADIQGLELVFILASQILADLVERETMIPANQAAGRVVESYYTYLVGALNV